jgi:transcriptional regulator with XRE-family HTH domain
MTAAVVTEVRAGRRPWEPVVLRGGAADPAPAAHPEQVAAPLTLARRAAGLTVTELARALHVSRPTVSMWERGSRGVARHYWAPLGAALRLSPDEVGALFAQQPPARMDSTRLPSLGWARRAAGISQFALARRLGVAPTTVSMWETAGVRVALPVVAELAGILGTDVATLTADPPAPRPETRPLRGARRAAGMTWREAAALLGIAVSTLARYEAGERPVPVAVLRKMAVLYRRPVAELLRLREDIVPLPHGARWRPEDVPVAIRALRTAAGMSKVALGRVLGRSGQAVRSWETGRTRPTAATCRRLEAVFGLPAGRFPY